MRHLRLAFPLLVIPALVAGCGGSSTGNGAAPARQPALSLVAKVRAASDVTSSAGSAKFALTSTVKTDTDTVTITGEGAVDNARRLGALTLTIGQAGGPSQSIEERFLGDALYIADPQQLGTFYQVALPDLVGTSLAAGDNPTAGFQALKAASGDVTAVGPERIRDTATTHYRGTYDVQAALGKVDGAAKQAIVATLQGSNVSAVPFDAYLDDQGRVRKLVQSLTLHPPAAQGQQVQTTTTVEAYDYGTPVTVTAPPAAQVKDGAPLINALKNAGTAG